jgi:chaperone BCS1
MSSNNSTNLSSENLLDTLLPGFGLLSRLISFYLQIDLSAYSLWIFIIASSWTFITFVLPKLFQQSRNWVLHYATSVRVMYQDPLYDPLVAFIAGQAELNQTRRSIAGTKASYNSPFRRLQVEEDEKQEETAQLSKDIQPNFSPDDQRFWWSLRYWNTKNPILFTPEKDQTFFFWHRGRMFALC